MSRYQSSREFITSTPIYPAAPVNELGWLALWQEWPPDLVALAWPELIWQVDGFWPGACLFPEIIVTYLALANAGWITVRLVSETGWRGAWDGIPRPGQKVMHMWRSRLRLYPAGVAGIPSSWGGGGGIETDPWMSGQVLNEVVRRPGLPVNSSRLQGAQRTRSAAAAAGYVLGGRRGLTGVTATAEIREATSNAADQLVQLMSQFSAGHKHLCQQLIADSTPPESGG